MHVLVIKWENRRHQRYCETFWKISNTCWLNLPKLTFFFRDTWKLRPAEKMTKYSGGTGFNTVFGIATFEKCMWCNRKLVHCISFLVCICLTQVNGDLTFDCGRHLPIVSTVCQLQQLLTRKYSVAMGVSYVLACRLLYKFGSRVFPFAECCVKVKLAVPYSSSTASCSQRN